MPIRTIVDAGDPAVRDFSDLTDVAARRVREPAQGLFIAEGSKVILRALATGLRPRRVMCSPRWYDEELAAALQSHQSGASCEVLLADPEVLREVTGYRVHRGALASFERPEPTPVAEILARAGTLGVLVDLVDHTNVGAIFRNAAALGVDGLLVTHRCADPWYRRSIKVSMGSVFAVPWAVLPDIPDLPDLPDIPDLPAPGPPGEPAGRSPAGGRAGGPGVASGVPGWLGLLHAAGITSYALTPQACAQDIRDIQPGRPRAVLIGSEGPGLPESVLAGAGLQVRIPMHHGVDSLNVAAATAIAFHHLAQPTGVHR